MMQSLRCLIGKNKPDSSICSPRDLASTIIPSRPISSGIARRAMPIGPTRISITTIGHRCVFCHGRRWAFDPARKLVVVHRVDTVEGLRRGLWFDDGRRVNNRQFLELTGKIMLASP